MVSKEGKSSSSAGQRFSATEPGDFARIIQMLDHCWKARQKPRGNYLRNRETHLRECSSNGRWKFEARDFKVARFALVPPGIRKVVCSRAKAVLARLQ
jgi:ribosomal protein L35